MSTPSEPPERRFTLDLRTGRIRPAVDEVLTQLEIPLLDVPPELAVPSRRASGGGY